MKKLREICREAGVSRRAVQGYENAGLVKSTARNKYGHLLYDEQELKRIKRIKFLQDIGLSLKEIAEVLDAPDEELRTVLEIQIRKLEESIEKSMDMIDMSNDLINDMKKKR